jgi:hypothetical protein
MNYLATRSTASWGNWPTPGFPPFPFVAIYLVMEKFSSEPRSEPEPDRSELQIWVQVRGFDQNRTVGSVRGSANSRTLANGF